MKSSPILTRVFRSQYLRRFLPVVVNRYSIFLLGLYLYALAIDYHGGISATLFFTHWIELFFVIYFYAYFYTILKPGYWRSLIAALPIVASYFIHDLFYLVYGKIFRLINVLELPELLQVIPFGYGVILSVFVVLPIIVFLSAISYLNLRAIFLGVLPFSIFAALIIISPNTYIHFINMASNGIVEWSDAESVESNGRYTMLFYREAERLNAISMTGLYRNRADYERHIEVKAEKIRQNSHQRNVHLIVLESFLDPRLFSRVKFSKDPVAPEFNKLFGERLGLSISPVFGGETAQAEFEVLCGVPALAKLSSMEFNVFSGAPVYCLPGMLDKLGYRTLVTNAYKPNYFNSLTAYKGIGFGEIYFPREYSAAMKTYFSLGNVDEEYYMFDGTLFDQNLAFVARSLKKNRDTPLFNYIMTSYGHAPHDIDIAQRPELIHVESEYVDIDLQHSTNQFFYRTQAIANYVNELIKLDKNSIIILVSDHLPPLSDGPTSYQELGYLDDRKNSHFYNRLMIIENGTLVVYNNMRHFYMPDLIYNYITGGSFCRQESCAFLGNNPAQDQKSLVDQYYKLMAHASK